MKKLFSILIICLLLFGCKKEKEDYRYKFTGDYTFTTQEHYWAYTLYDYDTINTYNGKVTIGKSDNTLKIDGLYIEPEITEDGSLSNNFSNPEFFFGGEFVSTTSLKYRYRQNAPGGGFDIEVTGIKTKQ